MYNVRCTMLDKPIVRRTPNLVHYSVAEASIA